jgi:hypothetical protein
MRRILAIALAAARIIGASTPAFARNAGHRGHAGRAPLDEGETRIYRVPAGTLSACAVMQQRPAKIRAADRFCVTLLVEHAAADILQAARERAVALIRPIKVVAVRQARYRPLRSICL